MNSAEYTEANLKIWQHKALALKSAILEEALCEGISLEARLLMRETLLDAVREAENNAAEIQRNLGLAHIDTLDKIIGFSLDQLHDRWDEVQLSGQADTYIGEIAEQYVPDNTEALLQLARQNQDLLFESFDGEYGISPTCAAELLKLAIRERVLEAIYDDIKRLEDYLAENGYFAVGDMVEDRTGAVGVVREISNNITIYVQYSSQEHVECWLASDLTRLDTEQ